VPVLETDTVSVHTLPCFAPDSDSPSRETRVEGFNPEEHCELSQEELIELFGEENMNYIFELRARQAALTVSRPSPDRRETTAITTNARKSKYNSTDNAGTRHSQAGPRSRQLEWGSMFLLKGSTSSICSIPLLRHSQ
jgi:hypothetical protein